MKNDNLGKCGHVKCAGGTGDLCFKKGAPMSTYRKDEYCPRCIEDHTDDEGVERKGTLEKSDCEDCGVCKECEHLNDCNKAE